MQKVLQYVDEGKSDRQFQFFYVSGMIDDDVVISELLHTTNDRQHFLTPPPDIKRSCRALSLYLHQSIYLCHLCVPSI